MQPPTSSCTLLPGSFEPRAAAFGGLWRSFRSDWADLPSPHWLYSFSIIKECVHDGKNIERGKRK